MGIMRGNNCMKQCLSHSISMINIPTSCNNPSKLPKCPFSFHLATIKEMGATRLHLKVKKWLLREGIGPYYIDFLAKKPGYFATNS